MSRQDACCVPDICEIVLTMTWNVSAAVYEMVTGFLDVGTGPPSSTRRVASTLMLMRRAFCVVHF